MQNIAVIAFAQLPNLRHADDKEEVELVRPVVTEVMAKAGLKRREIGFTVSGSSDYLIGRPFSFVTALDAIAPWPPIDESHVEMDGAWALYEAWIRLQHGDIDTALVYAYGKSSLGDLPKILSTQLDPYYLAPLSIDSISLAALQARALIDAGRCSEKEMAAIAARNRRTAISNPFAQVRGDFDVNELLSVDYLSAPLRKHDCPPISDGACALILASENRARSLCKNPAWIRGLDHRIESQHLGARDLSRSPSTELASKNAKVHTKPLDFAELHAPFSHQEIILKQALGLHETVEINPSGGALAANPMMVAGLTRIGEAATRLSSGHGQRAVAHATSGACLQQNLICVLETEQ
jgi:acetyl-CoA acetyltransferase